ncbi:MAG: DEAD/DEAH box helicase [Candidatus Brocadiaceae bacterium]|nr:DEAD/DEAH box helicase [Candidatus Brocadiaceae bacterium]
MKITDYHSKYYAHDLLRSSTEDGIEKISRSLFDAAVDLNPHQIEAALFALNSPLSKGIVLADEVGLGKTIEASIALCQYWAERKRKLLIICPASIRKQWSIELEEKFNIPSVILEAKTYNHYIDQGYDNPFAQDSVVICSYQFINSKKELVKLIPWDLAIIDEAHKLRNAYRASNVLGQAIKWVLEDTKKILLTATPLQNSLMELFGLSTIIDDYIFGDSRSFRQLYINDTDLESLKTRLQGFCKRTLRQQVLQYIPYTNRKAITIRFAQTDQEVALYQDITAFLQRPDTYAIPASQKSLITLVIRKILASSSYALISTLKTIKSRLEKLKDEQPAEEDIVQQLVDDESLDDEEMEELEIPPAENNEVGGNQDEDTVDREQVNQEITLLESFIEKAWNIKIDSKTKRLKEGIERGFTEAEKMGAQRKVIVFTESRRTQQYLKDYLDAHGYTGRVVTFNGTNTDQDSKKIYENWLERNKDTGRISGSKSSDMRIAILEHFRDTADILVATESAAEGINLQFCSLVINYDLPWNPQRIEQRIGRCHRYGQKFDVVVINFLNERNDVDRQVYDLLEYKFNLFSGVFGASDEVLGSLESGVDFEREVLKIYQQCRKPDEIQKAFAELQQRMGAQIQSKVRESKQILLEHFDEDVHDRLKVHLEQTQTVLDKMQRRFWAITQHVLQNKAEFNSKELSFYLKESLNNTSPIGRYSLISKRKDNVEGLYLYRMSHPLGEYVLSESQKCRTPHAEIVFDISNHPVKISVVESLKGKSGYLILSKLTIYSFGQDEYLLFNAFDDSGAVIHPEICEKMFDCGTTGYKDVSLSDNNLKRLRDDAQCHINAMIDKTLERNNSYYQEECDRLFRWADDLVSSAEKELKDTKNKLMAFNRQLRQSTSMQEKHDLEVKIKEEEKMQRKQRQRIFDVEDEIEEKRNGLIDKLKKKLEQKTTSETLFAIRWKVV